MCPVIRKRNMRNVHKEKHVTRLSADVALTYERDGNYVDITSGYTRVAVFSLSTHARCVYIRCNILFRVQDLFLFNRGSAVGSPYNISSCVFVFILALNSVSSSVEEMCCKRVPISLVQL